MSDPTAATDDEEAPPRWVLDEPSDADYDREEGVEDCDHATDDVDDGGLEAVALPEIDDAGEPPDGPDPDGEEE